jgi:hypothetical protein
MWPSFVMRLSIPHVENIFGWWKVWTLVGDVLGTMLGEPVGWESVRCYEHNR